MSGRVKMKKKTDNPWLICGTLAVLLILGLLIVLVANHGKEENQTRNEDSIAKLKYGLNDQDVQNRSGYWILFMLLALIGVTIVIPFFCYFLGKMEKCHNGHGIYAVMSRFPPILKDNENDAYDVESQRWNSGKPLKPGSDVYWTHKKYVPWGYNLLETEAGIGNVGDAKTRNLYSNMILSSHVPEQDLFNSEFV